LTRRFEHYEFRIIHKSEYDSRDFPSVLSAETQHVPRTVRVRGVRDGLQNRRHVRIVNTGRRISDRSAVRASVNNGDRQHSTKRAGVQWWFHFRRP